MTLALARAGADIILVQRSSSPQNTETFDKVSALGRKVQIVEADLGDKEQIRGLCKKVTGGREEGGLGEVVDIVVNCGGIQRRTPAENFPDEDWEEVRPFPFRLCLSHTSALPMLTTQYHLFVLHFHNDRSSKSTSPRYSQSPETLDDTCSPPAAVYPGKKFLFKLAALITRAGGGGRLSMWLVCCLIRVSLCPGSFGQGVRRGG